MSRCSRTCGSSSPRPARTTPSGRCWRAGWPSSADAYVGDGFGAVHRKHASVYDLPRLLPHAAGRPGAGRGRPCCASSPPTRPRPYVVVLGGAQAVGQAGRDRQPAWTGRPAADRRRHGLHVPGGPGPPGGELGCWRPTRFPQVTAVHGGGRTGAGVELVLPGGPRGGRLISRLTPSTPSCLATEMPSRPEGVGHRARRTREPVRATSWPTPRPCSGTARSGCSEFPAFADGTRAVAEAISAR